MRGWRISETVRASRAKRSTSRARVQVNQLERHALPALLVERAVDPSHAAVSGDRLDGEPARDERTRGEGCCEGAIGLGIRSLVPRQGRPAVKPGRFVGFFDRPQRILFR
jgi:hypothetical protein